MSACSKFGSHLKTQLIDMPSSPTVTSSAGVAFGVVVPSVPARVAAATTAPTWKDEAREVESIESS